MTDYPQFLRYESKTKFDVEDLCSYSPYFPYFIYFTRNMHCDRLLRRGEAQLEATENAKWRGEEEIQSKR